MEKQIKIDLNHHMHFNWFEIERTKDGVTIMCPEGCRRLLMRNGAIAFFNKEKDLWEKHD